MHRLPASARVVAKGRRNNSRSALLATLSVLTAMARPVFGRGTDLILRRYPDDGGRVCQDQATFHVLEHVVEVGCTERPRACTLSVKLVIKNRSAVAQSLAVGHSSPLFVDGAFPVPSASRAVAASLAEM